MKERVWGRVQKAEHGEGPGQGEPERGELCLLQVAASAFYFCGFWTEGGGNMGTGG